MRTMQTAKNIIEVNNLCKTFKIHKRATGFKGALKDIFHPTYEWKKAVDNVSFSIHEGEMVGFIGPNGYVELVGKRSYKMNVHISVILYDN